jgi:transcriptional regulator with XRE-family HTH domain
MELLSLGDRIRLVRDEAGMSREAFAAKLDVTPATVGRYEKNSRTPDAIFLNQLVVVFRCDPSWLLTGEGGQSNQDALPHPTQNDLFPKEFDPDLMMKVTTAINDIVMKRGFTVPVEKLSTVNTLAYADAYWRGKIVNTEYIEYLIGVSSLNEEGLTKERVFLEVLGGYLIAEKLPQHDGWLNGIKVIEITAEKKDDIDSLANKIFWQIGIKPTRGGAQRGRQLTDKFIDIYQGFRHLIIVINDAHFLPNATLNRLKSFRERINGDGIDDYKFVPGIILLGSLKTLISKVADIKEIGQRCIQINDQGQLVGLDLPLTDLMKRK